MLFSKRTSESVSSMYGRTFRCCLGPGFLLSPVSTANTKETASQSFILKVRPWPFYRSLKPEVEGGAESAISALSHWHSRLGWWIHWWRLHLCMATLQPMVAAVALAQPECPIQWPLLLEAVGLSHCRRSHRWTRSRGTLGLQWRAPQGPALWAQREGPVGRICGV